MKKNILIIMLLIPLVLFAQDWKSVKKNPDYLCGEGRGATIAEADKNALADLISQIAVSVEDATDITINQKNDDGTMDFRSRISTYSQATLTNTQRTIIHNEPDAHVGRWIKKSEIEKIFEGRKLKINDLILSALKAEERGKADDALRCYYWALALTQSLQHPNEAKFQDFDYDDNKPHMLSVWLPEQIKNVFADLKATVGKVNGSDVDLLITYKGKPVSSVDYTYFDGQNWSNIYSAKDGMGTLELVEGNTSDSYQVKFEYEYRNQSHIDKEVASVLNAMPAIPMRDAYIYVKNDAPVAKELMTTISQHNDVVTASTSALAKTTSSKSNYVKVMDKVTKAIASKTYTIADEYFTEAGLDIYNRLVSYGNARIVGKPQFTFYQNGDEVIGRGVQLAFSFKTGMRKSFVEDVVFTFNKDGKIDNISFGMGKVAETDILGKGVWEESARKSIMEFMENYKTAYALKRLDYIKSIFDDDAVIITGNVTRKMTMQKSAEGTATMNGSDVIKYNRQTKDEYLTNLAKCFDSNEFINIRFANNDVYKLAKGGEMYGIQIAQDYYSSSYGDKGYLFLIIDINNPQEPLIKVRTWQPEKDPNFGLYGPGDF